MTENTKVVKATVILNGSALYDVYLSVSSDIDKASIQLANWEDEVAKNLIEFNYQEQEQLNVSSFLFPEKENSKNDNV